MSIFLSAGHNMIDRTYLDQNTEDDDLRIARKHGNVLNSLLDYLYRWVRQHGNSVHR